MQSGPLFVLEISVETYEVSYPHIPTQRHTLYTYTYNMCVCFLSVSTEKAWELTSLTYISTSNLVVLKYHLPLKKIITSFSYTTWNTFYRDTSFHLLFDYLVEPFTEWRQNKSLVFTSFHDSELSSFHSPKTTSF